MPRDYRLYLRDILHAIGQIQQSVAGLDETEFGSHYEKLNSVLFNLMTIGEAAKNIPAEMHARYPHVPWGLMGRFRDLVVHHYWSLETHRIWQIIQENIPELKIAVETLLAELSEADDGEIEP